MPYVHSTLTNDTIYASYMKTGDGSPNKIERQVLIRGGANRSTKRLLTPKGVVTEVSEADLEFLEKDELFRQHKNAGFVKVLRFDCPTEKVVKDMSPKDGSAPKTPDDPEYRDKQPNVGKVTKEAA